MLGVTSLSNHEREVLKYECILELDRIVSEVKQSEEWEAVKMNILEIGLQQGIERGMARGIIETCQDFGISQSETLQKLMEKLSLDEDAAREQLEKYWR